MSYGLFHYLTSPKSLASKIRRHRLLPYQFEALQARIDSTEAELAHLQGELRARAALASQIAISKLPSPAPNGFRYPEVFILGSGPTLKETSSAERAVISNRPTIAMNRYLLFWDLIGIWPSFVFLADTLGVGRLVFDRLVLAAQARSPAPCFLIEHAFSIRAPAGLEAISFHRPDGRLHDSWSDSLDDRLFFHRGSLTSLLNLACILRLAPVIRLVGVDLNRPGTFFDSARHRYPDLFNPWDEEAAKQGLHATVASIERWGGAKAGTILDFWPLLSEHLSRRGMRVVSTQKSSLLVEHGLCAYEPIEP